MNFTIGGPGATKAADKTKKTTQKQGSGGTAFASLLEQATQAGDVSPTTTLAGVSTPFTPVDDGEERPKNTREQAKQLMKTLQQLAEDAFAQQPTQALADLQKTLSTTLPDRASLTAEQTQVLDELETRAAVEAEKLKP